MKKYFIFIIILSFQIQRVIFIWFSQSKNIVVLYQTVKRSYLFTHLVKF